MYVCMYVCIYVCMYGDKQPEEHPMMLAEPSLNSRICIYVAVLELTYMYVYMEINSQRSIR